MTKLPSFKLILITFIPVISLWAIALWHFNSKIAPDSPERWGQFGDAFGTLNALFSGLALAGVVISLIYQRHDLKLQLDEFKKSLEAQQDSAKAQGLIATINAKSAVLASLAQQYVLYENNNAENQRQGKAFSLRWDTVDVKARIGRLESELEELAKQLETEVAD